MSKADEYRQFANDCIVWARIATSDDQREQFLELAKKWMSDAESIDQRIELRPTEAAKASEMAGEVIDRLGDPLATDEGNSVSGGLSTDRKSSEIFVEALWR